ncbi:PTS sugar transporter subunit IIB [Olsenella sp. An290]|uniref:PTS sugar transporter subunit IIB n=1 Tax=Olsenella sp. An290 TaxID=1965625 RepID=UPI000B3A511C|nr:PTS sugar transporter subunit IIB [Olsenella sp. An290]OUO35921.1 PTS mannose transporter subunit IIAB [Olsenella sp. An290]
MIVGARVDFRLIHGQVGNLWANARQVSRFMVVDDDVATDDTQKQVLRMATPATCKLSVLPVDKAAANIVAGKYDTQRLFIVAKKPEVYARLVKAGVKIDELILGNMTTMNSVKKYGLNLNCDQGDLDAFAELEKLGVKMVVQLTPQNNPEPFKL